MSNPDAPKTPLMAYFLGGVAGVVAAVALTWDLPAGHLSDSVFGLKVATILISGFIIGVSSVWLWDRL